jgi:hypothetical protein
VVVARAEKIANGSCDRERFSSQNRDKLRELTIYRSESNVAKPPVCNDHPSRQPVELQGSPCLWPPKLGHTWFMRMLFTMDRLSQLLTIHTQEMAIIKAPGLMEFSATMLSEPIGTRQTTSMASFTTFLREVF